MSVTGRRTEGGRRQSSKGEVMNNSDRAKKGVGVSGNGSCGVEDGRMDKSRRDARFRR
jgi:hypothetical protein